MTKSIRISGYVKINDEEDSDGDIFPKGWLKLEKGQDTFPMSYVHEGFKTGSDPTALPIGVWDKIEEKNDGIWLSGIVLYGMETVDRIIELIKIKSITGLSSGTVPVETYLNNGKATYRKAILKEAAVCPFPSQNSGRITHWEEIETCPTSN